jgi:hypothetical protein
MPGDLDTTRELLSHQLSEAIAADPSGALTVITALQRDAEEHLREAVRRAAADSSWREIAAGLGVSRQAAHQRFRIYAKGVAEELKERQRAVKQAQRSGDADRATSERARRDELVTNLRTAARELRDRA